MFSQRVNRIAAALASTGPAAQGAPTAEPRIGNQARLRRLPGVIQPRLKVGPVDDPLEREADQFADSVTRPGPAPRLQPRCAACDARRMQRRGAAAGSPAPGADRAPEVVHGALGSPGRPLDAAAKAFFEPRLGADLGHVRIHTGALAEDSAAAVRAHAYTVGPDIVFGADRYQPGTDEGRRLLAHELTHVVQQTGPDAASARQVSRQPTPPGGDFTIHPDAMAFLESRLKAFFERLSPAERIRLKRNSTVAIGMATVDGEPRLVYTVANNGTSKEIREAADALDLHRWTYHSGVKGRGEVGAPNDAEQLMIGFSTDNHAELHGVAVSRRVCPDCGEVIPAHNNGRVQVSVIEDPIPMPRGPRLAPMEPAARTASGEIGSPAEAPVMTPEVGAAAPPARMSGRPSVLEIGGGVAFDLVVGILLDYIGAKIGEYFDRKDFERLLRNLQPEIDRRERAILETDPAIRTQIDKTQCYWIITLKYGVTTTTWVGGGRAGTVHSNSIDLVSVEVSKSADDSQGPLEAGPTVVAPAHHAVVQNSDFQTVSYSVPIVSWNAQIPGLEHGLPKFGGDRPSMREAEADVLRFTDSRKPVTVDSLMAWAKRHFPRGAEDPAVLKNIYSSHDFTGSDDARERAAMALTLRLRETKPQ